jgi:16S rRNA (guanine966-N2)-methyltransferase
VARIVGGVAGGRRLRVPRTGTRPTSDRAREALFNTLAGLVELDGARVLDLFAGSGAVGLEALSRGAKVAVLVESDVEAARTITANVTSLGLTGAEVMRTAVERHLALPPPAEPFDVVFADPPYALPEAALAEVLERLAGPYWVRGGGVVVVERSVQSPEPLWPKALLAVKHKRYGDTALWYRRNI